MFGYPNHITLTALRKSLVSLILLLSTLLLMPFAAGAATIEGKLNGLHCATDGHACPTDKLDPHLVAESDFVVQQPGGDYYFIPNLDRTIKARYVLENVRVSGDLNTRYKTVRADKLEVRKGDTYKTVWTQAWQSRSYEDLRRPGATRP